MAWGRGGIVVAVDVVGDAVLVEQTQRLGPAAEQLGKAELVEDVPRRAPSARGRARRRRPSRRSTRQRPVGSEQVGGELIVM